MAGGTVHEIKGRSIYSSRPLPLDLSHYDLLAKSGGERCRFPFGASLPPVTREVIKHTTGIKCTMPFQQVRAIISVIEVDGLLGLAVRKPGRLQAFVREMPPTERVLIVRSTPHAFLALVHRYLRATVCTSNRSEVAVLQPNTCCGAEATSTMGGLHRRRAQIGKAGPE